VITWVGLLVCVLIAALPVAVLPELPMLAAGGAAGLICAGGLALPSLGLAVTGAVIALLVFAAALLIAPAQNASFQAFLLGLSLLILLDATFFRSRFRKLTVAPSIARAHLKYLAASGAYSIVSAALLAVAGDAFPLPLAAPLRPILAGAGAVLVIGAVVHGTRRAHPKEDCKQTERFQSS